MINWEKTRIKLNRTDLSGYRPKVIVECDNCGKESTLTIRIKSKITNNQITWLCPKCVSNTPKVKEKLSKATTKNWGDNNYRSLITEQSKKLWDKKSYVIKHRKAMYLVRPF